MLYASDVTITFLMPLLYWKIKNKIGCHVVLKEVIAKLSGWGLVQVAPYGLHPPPLVMNFLGVLIQDIHNLPLLFVFPEVCGWQRWRQTPGNREREGGEIRELKPGARTACNWSIKRKANMGHVLVQKENDNYELQYNDVGCRVPGSNGLLKEGRGNYQLWNISLRLRLLVWLKWKFWWLNTVTCMAVIHLECHETKYHLIGTLNVLFQSPTHPPLLLLFKAILML